MSDHEEGGCQDAAPSGDTTSGRQGPPSGFPGGTGDQSGAMNAYDIPRYNSEGYVLGRPETANDPASAGNVQGSPVGATGPAAAGSYGGPAQSPYGQAVPGAMGHGTMNGAPGETIGGNGGAGQPGYQVPPQQTPYGSMGTIYRGPTAPSGYQPPYPGMAYTGMNPAYSPSMVPPGFQPPPAMGAMGGGPVYEGAPGYTAPYPGDPRAYDAAGQASPGLNAEHYGRIADVVKDIANGEQPDVNKIAALYSGFDTQFWKGALIGAVVSVLLTSETVKTAVAGTLGGIFGAFNKSESPSTEAGTKADAT